jgi:hypothetical protein
MLFHHFLGDIAQLCLARDRYDHAAGFLQPLLCKALTSRGHTQFIEPAIPIFDEAGLIWILPIIAYFLGHKANFPVSPACAKYSPALILA